MKFSNEIPTVEGYYWYQSQRNYAPKIGRLCRYSSSVQRKGLAKFFIMPFGGYDSFEDLSVTGKELWGDKIKEP